MANQRWSWGGVDNNNRRVFLRAWQDQTKVVGEKRMIRLAHHSFYSDQSSNPGYNERVRHLDLLSEGYEGFVVMCKAVDASARPRAIQGFNARDVIKLGNIVTLDGDKWGEMFDRVMTREFRA